ncbi:MAG TPA: ribosome small subunit-dependent GTPase A [Chitinophagaceae bacterium]
MKLEDLGYNDQLEQYRIHHHLEGFDTGRIIAEHKERYIAWTQKGEYEAEITGHLRFMANSREDFPAVGDWVALKSFEGGPAIIHHVYPRFSTVRRGTVGGNSSVQVIATNIDYAFLVQAVDRDFNLNRLERYLTLCYDSGVKPLIVLTKTDLVEEEQLEELVSRIQARIKDVPVLTISNLTRSGYDTLISFIRRGKTYCLLGSSGVGKSTLLNVLRGSAHMKTGAISDSTSKGRHVTSHRELVVLENGGLLVDNPGMREVGIADAGSGLETTFDTITRLAKSCRYRDCTHTREAGCAVREAVEEGTLDRAAYENYLKMEREKTHFEATAAERRQKDRQFGKMMKNYKKGQKKH